MDGAVDLREEEMEQSIYGKKSTWILLPKQNTNDRLLFFLALFLIWFILGLCFALDPSSVKSPLHLSNSCLTVTYFDSDLSDPHLPIKIQKPALTPDPMALLPYVSADVIIARGQYYWEVDVCNSSVYRVGKNSIGCGWTGLMPVDSFLPEVLTISQQVFACLYPRPL